MFSSKTKMLFSQLLGMSLGSMLIYASGHVPTDGLRKMRPSSKDPDPRNRGFIQPGVFIGIGPRPDGLAFPPGAHTLSGDGKVVLAAPPKNKAEGVSQTEIQAFDTINLAFDSVAKGAKGQGNRKPRTGAPSLAVLGVSGDGADIFIVVPLLRQVLLPRCTYTPFWDGSASGLPDGHDADGFDLQ